MVEVKPRSPLSATGASIDETAAVIETVVSSWAADQVLFAEMLRRLEPSWGSTHFDLAGGSVVLCGPGMFVNRGLAVGIETPMTDADFDELERRCREVGVAPAIDVTVLTHPSTRSLAIRRGYVSSGRVQALRRPLTDRDLDDGPSSTWSVAPVGGRLAEWQLVAAAGWNHLDGSPGRRASDAYAQTMARLDADGLLLASDPLDGRAVGCASISRRASVATLGAMATLPSNRRQGVQASMITERLRRARHAGCELAATTTLRDSASERNLRRSGFERWFELTTLTLPAHR